MTETNHKHCFEGFIQQSVTLFTVTFKTTELVLGGGMYLHRFITGSIFFFL